MKNESKRILCLHGFGTNADVLKFQLKQFKKVFADFEFVTPDGPVEIPKKIFMDERLAKIIEDSNIYSWGSFILMKDEDDTYGGFKPGIQKTIEILKTQGPFYAIMGFSQGSHIVGIICNLIETGQLQLDYTVKCFIYVSGVFNQKADRNNFKLYKTPSLHFIGINDFLADKSIILSSNFLNPFIIYHNQGHKIPTLTYEQIKQVRSFLEQDQQEWAKVLYVPKL